MIKLKNNNRLSAMIGNALEYYDTSLYGFMAPILIPIFLPKMDKMEALILTFLILPLSALIKPLGALVIGRIGDKHGRKNALIISITGMACITGIIGLLPTYEDIGVWAPILMMTCRLLQSFFVAGEYNGAAIFVLEHTNNKKGLVSGTYCAFTVVGILLASLITTIISYLPSYYWRLPYILGFATGIIGIILRRYALETPEFISQSNNEPIKIFTIFKNYKPFFQVIALSGFFGSLYNFHMVLMISFLPIVTSFTISQIMLLNFYSTFVYLCLLPLSGYLADKITIQKSMKNAAITMIILVYPLVSLIKYDNYSYIFLMKLVFAIITAWFAGPIHAYMQSLFPIKARYTGISVSFSLGAQLGGTIVAGSLWAWEHTHSLLPIMLLLLFWALLAVFALNNKISPTNINTL